MNPNPEPPEHPRKCLRWLHFCCSPLMTSPSSPSGSLSWPVSPGGPESEGRMALVSTGVRVGTGGGVLVPSLSDTSDVSSRRRP